MAGTSETEIKDIRLEKAGDKIKPSGKDTRTTNPQRPGPT